jgi:hypothetical protein
LAPLVQLPGFKASTLKEFGPVRGADLPMFQRPDETSATSLSLSLFPNCMICTWIQEVYWSKAPSYAGSRLARSRPPLPHRFSGLLKEVVKAWLPFSWVSCLCFAMRIPVNHTVSTALYLRHYQPEPPRQLQARLFGQY